MGFDVLVVAGTNNQQARLGPGFRYLLGPERKGMWAERAVIHAGFATAHHGQRFDLESVSS